MEANSASSSLPSVQKFFSDIRLISGGGVISELQRYRPFPEMLLNVSVPRIQVSHPVTKGVLQFHHGLVTLSHLRTLFRTACREAVAVNQVLQMLVDEMNSGGELMTMDQLKAAADYGKDIRPQVAGLATGTAAALAIKATGVFKNSPVWKPAVVVLPAWFAGFAMFRLYSNFNFVRISMRDGDSTLSRQLRAAYKKAAPPGSTTLENS